MTTWATECGIAEHSALLKAAVEGVAEITLIPLPDGLDPSTVKVEEFDLIHLNYHAALHSRWTPAVITELRSQTGVPITATYHDTGVPNSDQCKGIVEAADATVVHEPFDDLPREKAVYWRMGVQDWHQPHYYYGSRPVLGTVGFPFPWKNYDELARITGELDWAFVVIAPKHTAADVMRWEALNPNTKVIGFTDRDQVVSLLAGCDASAFMYTCANTGQSGAILQGIAARKPVFALESCRQFRALRTDPLGRTAIYWAESFEGLKFSLSHLTSLTGRPHAATVALAKQESWTTLGVKYADLWKRVKGL